MRFENVEGSGERAMSDNERALKEAEAEREELARRAEQGEDINAKLQRVNERIEHLKKDQQLIERAG